MTPVAEVLADLETATQSTNDIDIKAEIAIAHCAKLAVVDSPEKYAEAVEQVKGLTELEQLIHATDDKDIETAHSLHKSLIAKRDKWLKPVVEWKKRLLEGVTAYTRNEERKRLAEEERIRAEQKRIKDAEDLRIAQEQQLQAAVDAEKEGDTELAEAIVQAPTVIHPTYQAPVILPTAVPKIQGVSKVRDNWDFRVINEALVPNEFKTVDEKKLRAYAKAMKAQANVAGVEFFNNGSVSIKI